MHANPVNTESLMILDAIDRRGSFAKAAEELNKATSAISYGVQKLEEQLGISIFVRQGRRSVLTPAGRLILEEGRIILDASQQLAHKAKELATGWEPKLRISVESVLDYSRFFKVAAQFLQEHDSLEIDIRESVLSGGWEELEQDKVDLIVGAPGPVPLQKGYRAITMGPNDLVPVIAKSHPLAKMAHDPSTINQVLSDLRRVVMPDTAITGIARSAGFSLGKKIMYVQTMDQKVEAITAGMGIGHLPRYRIEHLLQQGLLLELKLKGSMQDMFIAWKISNKGKALHAITQMLSTVKWK